MTAAPDMAFQANDEEKSSDNTYIVQRGDTLAGVALRLGVKQSELKRANHMYGSGSLVAGQVLKMGSMNSTTTATAGASPQPAASLNVVCVGAAKPSPTPGDQQKLPEDVMFKQHSLFTGSKEGAGVVATSPPATAAAVASSGEAGVERTLSAVSASDAVDAAAAVAAASVASATAAAAAATIAAAVAAGCCTSEQEETATDGGKSKTKQQLLYDPPQRGGAGEESFNKKAKGDDETAAAATVNKISAVSTSDSSSTVSPTMMVVSNSSPRFRQGSNSSPSGVSVRGVIRYMFSPSTSEKRDAAFSETHSSDDALQSTEGDARDTRETSNASVGSNTARKLISMVRRQWKSGDIDQDLPSNEEEKGAGERELHAEEGMEVVSRSRGPSLVVDADVEHYTPPPEPEAAPVPLKLPGLVKEGSTIVTHETLARMELALPRHYRGYNWYLLFSTYRDGASYLQFYNRIKAEEPTYIVVENMKGEVFGGFATSAWSSGAQYYGTGECFLFTIEGSRVASAAAQKDNDSGGDGFDHRGDIAHTAPLFEGDITTHQWTGMNTYLQYSDHDGLGMGGGGMNGSFGLFIGEEFLTGSTGACDTFGNPALCSDKHFQISQVEVWGFTTAESEMGARLERLRKTLRGRASKNTTKAG